MGRKQRTAAHGRALSAALQGNENGVRHGESTRTRRTPENAAWQNMKARCLRPSHPQYRHYGGRGISVCPQWMTFEGFLADVGRRPTAGVRQLGVGWCRDEARWDGGGDHDGGPGL